MDPLSLSLPPLIEGVDGFHVRYKGKEDWMGVGKGKVPPETPTTPVEDDVENDDGRLLVHLGPKSAFVTGPSWADVDDDDQNEVNDDRDKEGERIREDLELGERLQAILNDGSRPFGRRANDLNDVNDRIHEDLETSEHRELLRGLSLDSLKLQHTNPHHANRVNVGQGSGESASSSSTASRTLVNDLGQGAPKVKRQKVKRPED